MVTAGHSTPETADLLGRERETPSLSTGWLLTLQQTRGFVARRCPAPNANAKFSLQNDTLAQTQTRDFVAERRSLTVAGDHAKDSIESLATILRRHAPSQSLARALRRSARLKPNRKSQRKRATEEVGKKRRNGASLQIVEPELAENATMGPKMTKSRAPMQEQ